MSAEFPHGTWERYKSKLKCRCAACRAANSAYQREYMNRHPEQRRKAKDRQQVRNGNFVRVTGPSGWMYRPGLYALVPAEHRKLVRAEIEEANRRARECK